MNDSTAKGLVIGCTAGAAILASIGDLAAGRAPSVRLALGATIAAAILYAIAEVAPRLAAGFALLLFVGAALTDGAESARIITKALGQSKE